MPNILDRVYNTFFKSEQPTEQRAELSEQVSVNPIAGTLNFSTLDTYTQSKSMKLSACFRCVNVVSDGIAIMEFNNYIKKANGWKQKQYNTLYALLNIKPNEFMNAFTFKKQLVQNLLMSGNAYILIKRDSQDNIYELILLEPSTVQVILMNGDIFYNVISTSYFNLPLIKAGVYNKADIIHIMNFSLNNFVGISTLNYANLVLGTAYSAEMQANNYFSSNNILTGILKPSAGNNLTEKKAKAAKEAFLANLNSINTGGASLIVLDSGLDYQPIQTNPKQAMLNESRELSALQICQFFGVPPQKVFLDKRNVASTNEAQQIEFLNSTLLPLVEKIEAEFYSKLVLPIDYDTVEIKADVTNLLRLNASEQAAVFTSLYNIGAITSNEIRDKMDCDKPVKGGDRAFINQDMQPLDNILNDVKANMTPAPTSGATGQNNFNNTNTNQNG
jgi:HK97 family phage portal protein